MKLILSKWFSNAPAIAGVLCLTALFVTNAFGQDFFDGDTSNPGDWNDPLNWTGDILPSAGTNPQVGSADGGALIATANISGPLTNDTINELKVGSKDNSVGVVNHSAGTLNTGGWSFIGVDGSGALADGTYNLSGSANLEVNGNLYVGLGGGAGLSKGTLTIADNAVLNLNGSLGAQQGALVVGANDGNIGSATQTGGSVTYNSWMTIGESGGATGTYNISGGSLNQNSDWLTIGEAGGAQGTLDVSGTADINLLANGATLGRRDGGTGTIAITGSTATFDTTGLLIGVDSDSFDPTNRKGTLDFTADLLGVTPILASGDVRLNDGSVSGSANLLVDMTSAPAGNILLVDVGGSLFGTFAGLPQGAPVANSGGRFISYTFGDGNDIGLIIPEPSTLMLCLVGLGACLRRKRYDSN